MVYANDTNPHALQVNDQILVLVQQQDLSYVPAIRQVLDTEAHADGVNVRTFGGEQFWFPTGTFAKRFEVSA